MDIKRFGLKGALVAVVVFTAIRPGHSYTVPANNRTDIFFNTGWKYLQGDATDAQTVSYNDASWTTVALPHSTKWVTPSDITPYLGISWYRKHFTVGTQYQGSKVYIRIEAAMQLADVWVNGTFKLQHNGGYTPFTIDITDDISYGTTDNIIAVRINSSSNSGWAPGRPSGGTEGIGTGGIDFQYLGGLYRDAVLYVTDKLHVTDAVYANKVAGSGIFVTYSSVTASSATVSVKTDVYNEYTTSKSVTVISDLVNTAGVTVQTATSTMTVDAGVDTSFTQSLVVSNPSLWHPNSPNLYTLHTTVRDGSTPVDYCATRIGIRSIEWTNSNGIIINGQSFKAQGANMHQEMFGLGNAVPKRSMYYALRRFKEAGMDFIRGAHYPHHPAFYNACDELGILVDNSITGWQTYFDTDSFKTSAYRETRDMIRRDRNHPSVVLWETQLNESNYTTAWAQTVNTLAHEEYPGAYTCGTRADGNWAHPTGGSSVVWDVFIGASQHNIRGASTTQPVFICEYGSWEYGGYTSTSDVAREAADSSLLQQCYNIQESLNKNRALSWYSADAYWVYSDYCGYLGVINKCGIVDFFQIPKFSYYFFRSQRDPSAASTLYSAGPMVSIANRWTSASSTTVKVFSNCDQVSLYLNNTLVDTRSPDTDANSTSLLHPPFTFSVSAYEAGTLRAVGLIGDAERAWDTVITPGTAARVVLRPENDTIIPDGSDARLVWIDVVDTNGTVVPSSTASVTLSASGNGVILGPNPVAMRGGQLAVWVSSNGSASDITVTAASTGLKSGTATLIAEPVTSIQHTFVRQPVAVPAGTIRRFVVAGKMIDLSGKLHGKNNLITLFDLSGKMLYKTVVHGKAKKLRVPRELRTGVIVVEVKEK